MTSQPDGPRNAAETNGAINRTDLSLKLCEILEEWLILVGDGEDVLCLAQCTEHGLMVDNWSRPGIERGLKGKNVILTFHCRGEERKEEFDAYRRVQSAGASKVRIWKPIGFGTYEAPNLKALHQRHNLGELLYWDKPWDSEIGLRDPFRKPGWAHSDMGNAERMHSYYGQTLKHCLPWKKWLVWNGQFWQADDLSQTTVLAKRVVRKIHDEALAEADQDQKEKILKFALKSESCNRIDAMIKLARSEPGIPILPADFDPDPWLLNVRNGTINLKTGDLQRHSRNDLITRMAQVDFDMDAKSALWESFLVDILPDDMVRRFVQRIFGIALAGNASENILPIFWGSGANGKSTILNTIRDMLGSDYAIMAPPSLLFAQQGEGHPTKYACLFGKRLVIDMESAEEKQLNEALVKQLTGSDAIQARRMMEDFWTFKPTHTLILGTNHRPVIKETKNAIWRRVKLIPFTVEIPEEMQNKDLAEQLKDDYPAILAWAVQGCLQWLRDGLMTPKAIDDVTQEYRDDQDPLALFFAEECSIHPDAKCQASHIYHRYRKFAERSGETIASQKMFGSWMTDRKFERYENHVMFYRGIELQSRSDASSNGY